MAAKPKSIDEYLAALSGDKRAALEKLRKIIRTIVPKAEEGISYQLPAFRLNGEWIAAFGATANHCSFYPMSGSTLGKFKKELKNYHTSKAAIRFQADKPLPATLVRKLIKARISEKAGPPEKAKVPRASARKRVKSSEHGSSQTDPAVTAFLDALDHPRKPELEAVRQLILAVSPEIREGIKWNSPSFRTTDYFATINVHAKDRLRLILHRGAKAKDNSISMQIADPTGLLQWLAKDRCLVTLCDGKDFRAKRAALEAVLREWIRQV